MASQAASSILLLPSVLLTSKLTMIEFVASRLSPALSRTIEEFAADQRLVSAIVVPWESDATNLPPCPSQP